MKHFMLRAAVWLTLCLTAGIFASCEEDSPETDPVVVSELTATPAAITFAWDGGTQTVEVKAKNAAWKATTDCEWLKLTDDSGTEDGTFTVATAGNNTGVHDFTGEIIISAEGVEPVKITVTQTHIPPVQASVDKLAFTCGDYYSKKFRIESEVEWTAQSEADWVILDEVYDEGSYNGTVTVSVKKNTGDKRETEILIFGKGVGLKQIPLMQKAAFSSDLVGTYEPFQSDPERPAEFFITPTYPQGAEIPKVDISFLFGPGAEWEVPIVTDLANQIVGMLYGGGLEHFEFRDDGTISAGYRTLLGFDMSAGPTYSTEVYTYPNEETMELVPSDAITYYTENGMVYFCIDKAYLSAIGNSELDTDLTEMIEGLRQQYPEIGRVIVSNDEFFGLPLKYSVEGTKVKLWVDREMMMPFIPLLSELAETLLPEELPVQMDPNDPETTMTVPVKNLVNQLLDGLFAKTETLELGISLAKLVSL